MAFDKMHQHLDKMFSNHIMPCTLEECVYAIAQLPCSPPILLQSEAEKQVWLMTKQKYQSASLWLRHILLGETLQPEAYQPPALYIQPFAEFLAAYFRLVIAVYARTTNFNILVFSSPTDLWFYSCKKMSDSHLGQQGLTDFPLLMGKRQAWLAGVKICSNLKALLYKPDSTPTLQKDPTTLVILEAQAIAKVDSCFYSEHFLPYMQAVRRALKKNHKCKNVQFHYLLADGTLFETGKNKKLSGTNNRKTPKLL